jgi:hypothetical protein
VGGGARLPSRGAGYPARGPVYLAIGYEESAVYLRKILPDGG